MLVILGAAKICSSSFATILIDRRFLASFITFTGTFEGFYVGSRRLLPEITT